MLVFSVVAILCEHCDSPALHLLTITLHKLHFRSSMKEERGKRAALVFPGDMVLVQCHELDGGLMGEDGVG